MFDGSATSVIDVGETSIFIRRYVVRRGRPVAIWRAWIKQGAEEVRGRTIAGGHFFPEVNPDETAGELAAFLG